MGISTPIRRIYCSDCGKRLTPIVAGNIIDYRHPDGLINCAVVEEELLEAA